MLSPTQKAVYIKCCDFLVNGDSLGYVVSGIAGSGKTTIIQQIMKSPLGDRGMVLCPTGRATTRYSSIPVSTLHSLLYRCFKDSDGSIRFYKADPKQVATMADFFIVDEASMLSSEQAQLLLDVNRPTLFFGDNNQLPPIGDDNFSIMDMTDFHLTEIHRNVADSLLYRFIDHYRRTGEFDRSCCGDEIKFINKNDLTKQFFEQNSFDSVIVSFNREKDKYNRLIRIAKGFYDDFPMVGDTIMSLRNNMYNSTYVPNGMRAKITDIEPDPKDSELIRYYCVIENTQQRFDVQIHKMNWINPNDIPKDSTVSHNLFDFGYAMTVWKSQGSEFDNILFIENDSSFVKNNKNRLVYTALSRAKKSIIIAK